MNANVSLIILINELEIKIILQYETLLLCNITAFSSANFLRSMIHISAPVTINVFRLILQDKSNTYNLFVSYRTSALNWLLLMWVIFYETFEKTTKSLWTLLSCIQNRKMSWVVLTRLLVRYYRPLVQMTGKRFHDQWSRQFLAHKTKKHRSLRPQRIIPTERLQLVNEVSANFFFFCGCRVLHGQRYGSLRPYSRLSRP
jgi:hypothetical protein